jgi:hypothetical protein
MSASLTSSIVSKTNLPVISISMRAMIILFKFRQVLTGANKKIFPAHFSKKRARLK